MIRRSSKKFINNFLKDKQNWKILDIGCGFNAHEAATVICDIQDLSNYYKEKNFIKLTGNNLPFKDPPKAPKAVLLAPTINTFPFANIYNDILT